MAPEVGNLCFGCMHSASFPHVHLLGTLASSSGVPVLDSRKIDSDTAPTLSNITRRSTLPGNGPHHLPSFDLLYKAEGPVYLQNERKPVANWGPSHLRFLKQEWATVALKAFTFVVLGGDWGNLAALLFWAQPM